MRSRLLPHPWLSAVLAVLWLLLNGSWSPGHVLLGATLGLAIGLVVRSIFPAMPRMCSPSKAAVYALLLLRDIVVANFQVARRVLGPLDRLRPRLVVVPLDLDEPVVASLLALTVTLTPGTVAVDLDLPGRRLTVHALDAPDDASVIEPIKSRYEARLKEIFGC